MNAVINGVPSLDGLDGWWVEGCIAGNTGRAIGKATSPEANGADAVALYDKLEQVILPLYVNDRNAWLRIIKGQSPGMISISITTECASLCHRGVYALDIRDISMLSFEWMALNWITCELQAIVLLNG